MFQARETIFNQIYLCNSDYVAILENTAHLEIMLVPGNLRVAVHLIKLNE